MRSNPEDGKTYSRWEREERKKPPKPLEEDEEPPDEETMIKPFDEGTLV